MTKARGFPSRAFYCRPGDMPGRYLLEGEFKRLQRGLQQTIVRDDLTDLLNRCGLVRIFRRE